MRQVAFAIALIVATTIGTQADQIPSFQLLGVLPGYAGSGAGDITPDGLVAVGSSWRFGPYEYEACRWSRDGQITGLGDLPGGPIQSSARAVSADGNVIVGFGTHATSRRHAFRWTPEQGMVDLGDFPGGIDNSEARDVSADGCVVVGFGDREYASEAFRWTAEDGMVGLGYVPGYSSSWAAAVSSGGAAIVGSGDDGYGSRQAFRWTAEEGMVGLGDLPGGTWPFESAAYGVSADGRIVVGRGESSYGNEAMRWTEDAGMVTLGDLAGGACDAAAVGVTADGAIIIGQGETDWGEEAFFWTEDAGMRRLLDVLEDDYGLDLGGWRLVGADISDDGQFIVGSAENPEGSREAFIARIPEPQTFVLTMAGVVALAASRRRYR